MAGRIYRVSECIRYEKSILSDKPVLKVKLFNMRLEEYPSELKLTIDTGFEGSIMVTNDIYEFFEVGELPRRFWRTYRTLAGPLTMKIDKALIQVKDIKFETYVETPLIGNGKMLVGRELLNKIVIVLDNPRKETCLG